MQHLQERQRRLRDAINKNQSPVKSNSEHNAHFPSSGMALGFADKQC
jgi:hypothetical protein